MELNQKDRIIILNYVLPKKDTRENMRLYFSIFEKIKLTDSEMQNLEVRDFGGGRIEIFYKDSVVAAIDKPYLLTDKELFYLKTQVEQIDRTGNVSLETFDTLEKISSAKFEDNELNEAFELSDSRNDLDVDMQIQNRIRSVKP